MPRRYVDGLCSPPRSATRPPRTPQTPVKPPQRHHYRHRNPPTPTETVFTDASSDPEEPSLVEEQAYDRGFSPTPIRTPSRFHRLSRMMAYPWQGNAHPHQHPPPLPPHHPAFATSFQRKQAQVPQKDALRSASHSIIWIKGSGMLSSGVAGVCFLGAFTMDQMLRLDFPGFTHDREHTDAQSFIVAAADPTTFPPGSPLAGWSSTAFLNFFIHYSSLLAAISCALAVVAVAQGNHALRHLPRTMRWALSGWADRERPGQRATVPTYGAAGVKFWLYLVFLVFPTVAFIFVMSALSSTSHYLSGLDDIGSSTSCIMGWSSILTAIAFVRRSKLC